MNLFNHRIEAFVKQYVHLSLKPALIALFLFSSVFMGLFMVDSSLFSASLVNSAIYNSDSLVEASDEYAGLLPDSPLFSLTNSLKGDFSKEDAYVFFAKILKAEKKNKNMTQQMYNNFILKLNSFSDQDKEEIISFLIFKLQNVSIEEAVFPIVFDLYAREQLEGYWVMQLAVYMENDGAYTLAKERAKFIFEHLAQKGNWKEYIQEKEMLADLFFIKQNIVSPTIDGETFHAAPDDWMENNEVWKSL